MFNMLLPLTIKKKYVRIPEEKETSKVKIDRI